MMNLKKYLKYYFLEEYLFNEVTKNFQKYHHLTPEEFFAIIIWKRNASKTKVLRGIEKTGKTIHKITFEIFKAKIPEQKLNILTKIPGIGVAIASAILTVCYPNEFTIADYRAIASLKDFNKEIKGNLTVKTYPYKPYFAYLKKCKMLARKYKLTLRDFDRILWAKNFYEGVNGLKQIVKGFRY